MDCQPHCYQPDCGKCSFKDSCRNYIKPPMDIYPYNPPYNPWYPSTGDPLPPLTYTICNAVYHSGMS